MKGLAKRFLETIEDDIDLNRQQPERYAVDKTQDVVKVPLYAYQARSVEWMLEREGVRWDNEQRACVEIQRPPSDLPVGGILCEEMGLGKSLEIIMLIALHKRNESGVLKHLDRRLIRTGVTLIICPPSIVSQWQSELTSKARFKWLYYGEKSHKSETKHTLAMYDVILTDFITLTREIHLVRPDHQRSRRFERKYERLYSPLVELEFWRICVDEAQMIENGLTLAAEATSLIPRVNTWAITGTPFGSHADPLNELRGLMAIVRAFHLYDKNNLDWTIQNLKLLSRRNTKQRVNGQLHIPPQHFDLHVLKFSRVEAQYYRNHLQEIMHKLERKLSRLRDGEDLDVKDLNMWLLRLRQTCCHLQLGEFNANRLGEAPKSLTEVLDTMMKGQKSAFMNLLRRMFEYKIKIGVRYELLKNFDKSIEIYEEVLAEIEPYITEMIKENDESLENMRQKRLKAQQVNHDRAHHETEDEEERVAARFHVWIMLKHKALFDLASVRLHLEEKEVADELFEKAEEIRKYVTDPAEEDAKHTIETGAVQLESLKMKEKMKEALIPNIQTAGIGLRFVGDNLKEVVVWLNDQMKLIEQYRKLIHGLVTRELHTDYGRDAALQEIAEIVQDYLNEALRVRKVVLQGNEAQIDEERERRANQPQRPLPMETEEKDLPEIPALFKPPPFTTLRHQMTKLEEVCRSELVKQSEVFAGKDIMHQVKNDFKIQNELLVLLERELGIFRRMANKRIVFYRILQKLSDNVALPTSTRDPNLDIRDFELEITALKPQLEKEKSKLRYLEHLSTSASQDNDGTICAICQDAVGNQGGDVVLTKCQHLFCSLCLRLWLRNSRTCPNCTAGINISDITLIRKDASTPSSSKGSSSAAKDVLPDLNAYGFMKHPDLGSLVIKYGTKVGTIVSHILHLIEEAPVSFKCLVFCQWDQVLSIFESAFRDREVKFARFGSGKGHSDELTKFREDTKVKVMLLSTKRQNAGLTLIQANHVFLVEPCLNIANELQAISRVHRVGQEYETWIHRYIMDDTIERQIYTERDTMKIEGEELDKTAHSMNDVLVMLQIEIQRLHGLEV